MEVDEEDVPLPPPLAPSLRRLNSGLADLLSFGPTLQSGPLGLAGGAEGAGEEEEGDDSGAAEAKSASGSGGGRRTRAKKEASPSAVKARLTSRAITASLHEVVSRLFGYEPMVVYTPDAFLKTMWINLPAFSGFKQQDAEEFMRALLNRVDEEGIAVGDDAPPGGAGAAPRTAMQQMFGGATSTTITCTVCGHVSRREEEFFGPFGVEVPVKDRVVTARGRGAAAGGGGGKEEAVSVPLSACLDEALSEETMAGDSAYFCDRCGKKVTAQLVRRLSRAPPLLVVHIVRTSWSNGGAKVQTHVAAPFDGLSLLPWMEDRSGATSPRVAASAAGSRRGAGKRAAESAAPVEGFGGGGGSAALASLYDCHGIVQHMGRGVREGHYIAYARNDTGDEWYCYNDARLSVMTTPEVAAVQGYLYVYQRRHLALPTA